MLRVQGPAYRTCGGMSRGSVLRVGALGVAGLSLPNVLRLRAESARPTRKTSVILFWLGGGPSHIDTYDMKPDAPAEFRGDFREASTNVPGIRICDLLPAESRVMDKLAVVR